MPSFVLKKCQDRINKLLANIIMIKKAIFTLIVLLCASHGFAQLASVRDNSTNKPLEFATLRMIGSDIYEVTDRHGNVEIDKFLGADSIEVRMLGYVTKYISYEKIIKNKKMISMFPNALTMDEAVVSANKWAQPKNRVPSKITLIKKGDYFSVATTADMMNNTGDVFVQKSQQSGGSPMIRGFATNRVLIAVDGVRMNTAIFRSGNLQNIISIDPLSVQTAEVLFGPASVMYGSDAIGGVMSFSTLRTEFSKNDSILVKGNAQLNYASATNERTAHIDMKLGFKKLALVTSITHNQFGNTKMGSYGPDEYLCNQYVEITDSADIIINNENSQIQIPTEYSQINVLQKLSYLPTERLKFDYSFIYSQSSDNPRYDRLIEQADDGSLKYAVWNYGPQKWLMNNLNVTHKSNNVIYDMASFALSYQNFEESRIDRKFGNSSLRERTENVNAVSANIDMIKHFSEKDKITYGFESVINFVDSDAITSDIITGHTENTSTRYPNSEWLSTAIFATFEHVFSQKSVLNAGVRYNHYYLKSAFDNTFYPFPFDEAVVNNGAVTGSLGYIYSILDKFAVTANISTGFRSPNVDDLGKLFDSEPGTVVVPNPEIGAEYAISADIGLRKKIGKTIDIYANAYYTYLDNALVRRDFLFNDLDSIIYDGEMSKVQALQNAAFARVYGVQAGLDIDLALGFGFSSRFNWQSGVEEMDDGSQSPLRHVAPMFGKTAITYKAKSIQAEIYSYYNGKISNENMAPSELAKTHMYVLDTNGQLYSPSWWTLNIQATCKVSEIFSVNLGIENILDTRYRPYSSGVVAPGRNFIIGVRASF